MNTMEEEQKQEIKRTILQHSASTIVNIKQRCKNNHIFMEELEKEIERMEKMRKGLK